MPLADRVAIVTGAAKPDSIGHAAAAGLAREGAHVAVADLYEPGFREVARAVGAAGRLCLCIRTDVADPASVEAMVRRVAEAFGRIDVLVNAVGGSWGITPDDLTAPPRRGFVGVTNCNLNDWRTILSVNLDGAFYCARAVAPHIIASPGGAIVNFASVAARKGLAPDSEGSSGPYAVAKAGIIALTKQLALELGPHGVRDRPRLHQHGASRGRRLGTPGPGTAPGASRRDPARPARPSRRHRRGRRAALLRGRRLCLRRDDRRQRRPLLRPVEHRPTRARLSRNTPPPPKPPSRFIDGLRPVAGGRGVSERAPIASQVLTCRARRCRSAGTSCSR